jgi:hypothetical protein
VHVGQPVPRKPRPGHEVAAGAGEVKAVRTKQSVPGLEPVWLVRVPDAVWTKRRYPADLTTAIDAYSTEQAEAVGNPVVPTLAVTPPQEKYVAAVHAGTPEQLWDRAYGITGLSPSAVRWP